MSKARDSIEDLKTIDANLAAKAPLASPSFTGTGSVNGKLAFFDGNTQTRNGGVATEANAALINFGLNEGSGNRFGGSYNQASQGGMLNFDTRANQPLFQIYGRAAGVAEATGTALLNIDSAGRVTMPKQPAFRAYHNIGSQSVAGGNTKIPITTVTLNAGNHYNASTSTFTAPVTGNYYLNWYSIYNGAVSNEWALFVFSAGSNQGTKVHFSKNNANWDNVRLSGVYPMTAGSTVYVANGGNTVTYHGGVWSGFSGYLIG